MKMEESEVIFAIGNQDNLNKIAELSVLSIFSEKVLAFCEKISTTILSYKDIRKFPDVLAFGFWCRKANLEHIIMEYRHDIMCRYGKGIVYHIVPSNLPIMFAYTMVAGLLSGNANIVKLPSKSNDSVIFLTELIREVISYEHYKVLAPYVTCVSYNRNNVNATRYFSAICDVRVVWGGDRTVDTIRTIPIKSRSIDITFADRYSICVIDSSQWLSCNDKEYLLRSFYADTFMYDQNACSSPVLVAWLGEHTNEARKIFWELLHEIVCKEYELYENSAIKKLESICRLSTEVPEISLCSEDNYIVRLWATKIKKELLSIRPGGGFFIECGLTHLTELLPIFDYKCQTITYYGVPKEQFYNLLNEAGPKGIDRIVPIGHALEFSLKWDGYDLVRSLSRVVNIVM